MNRTEWLIYILGKRKAVPYLKQGKLALCKEVPYYSDFLGQKFSLSKKRLM
ncbi:hypothetical protein ES705_26312 [subsurface metagenome]